MQTFRPFFNKKIRRQNYAIPTLQIQKKRDCRHSISSKNQEYFNPGSTQQKIEKNRRVEN